MTHTTSRSLNTLMGTMALLPALAHLGVRVRREREQPPPELGRVGRAGRQREEEAPDAEQRRT